jgi:KaiC/GvpD/RAD55 family RecA-like ATPase
LKQADEYFDKMTKLSPEILSKEPTDVVWVARSKAVYFAAKARWEESNQCFEKLVKYVTTVVEAPGVEIWAREDYAWALFKQGRAEEARNQLDRVQRVLEQAEERFRHANLQLSLMVQRKVQVGEEFEMRLDLVNVGRKPASLVRVEGLTHPEFSFFQMPTSCTVKEGSISAKDKTVGPFEVETLKLKLSATKAGSYSLNPEIVYFDDLGHTKTFKLDPISITVLPAKSDYEVLPGRVTTGTMGLDKLLLGGIPEKLVVILNASSSDERQQIIKRFLEAGISGGETTLYITCEVTNAGDLAQINQSNLSLIVCSLQADLIIQDQTNVYKLKGIENLTDIDIVLAKYLRTPNLLEANRKRACIDLLSDVLLQHHAVITRKWLNSLILNLKSKGFTILAVINPLMHPPEEFQAILSQFDGEIRIAEKETVNGAVKMLKVVKLQGQSYLKEEVPIYV